MNLDTPIDDGTSSLEELLVGERRKEIDAHIQRVRPLMRGGDWRLLMKVMDQIYNRNKILFCIDVEAWEKNTTLVTEIGIAIYDPRNQANSIIPQIRCIHIIIKETESLRNGRYVPDNKFSFAGRESYLLCSEDAINLVQELANYYFDPDMCGMSSALVGHDVRGDIKWLKTLGLHLPELDVVDTQAVFAITHGKQGNGLANVLRAIGQHFSNLHNAGNDAYHTVILCLCLSDPSYRNFCKIDSPEGFEYFPAQLPKSSKKNKSTLTTVTETSVDVVLCKFLS